MSTDDTSDASPPETSLYPPIVQDLRMGMALEDLDQARGLSSLEASEGDSVSYYHQYFDDGDVEHIQYQVDGEGHLYEFILFYKEGADVQALALALLGRANRGKIWRRETADGVTLWIWTRENVLVFGDARHFSHLENREQERRPPRTARRTSRRVSEDEPGTFSEISAAVELSSAWSACFEGVSLSRIGRFEEALVCFDEGLTLDPDHGESLVNKAWTLLQLERHSEIVETLDAALALDLSPKMRAIASVNRLNALWQLGRYEACATAISEIDRDPTCVPPSEGTAHHTLGLLRERLELEQIPADRDPARQTVDDAMRTLRARSDGFPVDAARLDQAEKLLGAPLPGWWRKALEGSLISVPYAGGQLTFDPLETADHATGTEAGQALQGRGLTIIAYLEAIGDCLVARCNANPDPPVLRHDHATDRLSPVSPRLSEFLIRLEEAAAEREG